MSETQAALLAAWERFNARNMFVHNCGLFESYENMRAVRLAQVACWQAGECCGCQGADGRCLSRMVELSRHAQMLDNGVNRSDAAVMSTICEHSDMASLIEITFRTLNDNGSDEPLWLVAKTLLTQEALGNGSENYNG